MSTKADVELGGARREGIIRAIFEGFGVGHSGSSSCKVLRFRV